LYLEGQFPESLDLFEQAIAIRERMLGPEHPRTIESRSYRDFVAKNIQALDK
jgi:hypothetical protein